MRPSPRTIERVTQGVCVLGVLPHLWVLWNIAAACPQALVVIVPFLFAPSSVLAWLAHLVRNDPLVRAKVRKYATWSTTGWLITISALCMLNDGQMGMFVVMIGVLQWIGSCVAIFECLLRDDR